MERISLTIDGSKAETPRGRTVLEAARQAGIYIPTLCHTPDLKPFGACRMCLVEIENMRGFPASCTTPATDGMVVHTDTPRLSRLRRNTLQLLIADHPLECLACAKNQRCELQALAAYLGVYGPGNLRKTSRAMGLDTSNPFFGIDHERCILCGRCVRACQEISSVMAIDFIYRGYKTKIGTLMDRPLAQSLCVSCGECLAHCPVGAMYEKHYPGLPTKEVASICPYCATGCAILIQVKGNQVVGVAGDPQGPANLGALCVKGRFGYEFIHSPQRLTKPLIKRNGKLEEATWEEALELVAEKLSQYANGAFAGVSSARCTNEDNYIFQKLIRAVMGSHNIDHCARL